MSNRTLLAAIVALGMGASVAAQAGPSLQERLDALSQQIHLRYQHYPPALASHRADAEEVLAVWNRIAPLGESNASAANVQRMADWLDAALRAVMPGGSGVLPPPPEFEQPVVVGPSETAGGQESPVLFPKQEDPEPAAEAIDPPVAEAPRSRVQVLDPPVKTIENPYVTESVPADNWPKADPEPSANPLRNQGRRSTESRFVGPRATAKPVVPETPADEPRRSKWSKHPSAAPLEWRDPFRDDPAASPNPLRSSSRQAQRPEFRAAGAVKIDIRQLAAEVRGYNAAVRALQAAVMGLGDTDLVALSAAEEELNRLEERRQFIDLYREGLTPSQRQALPESPSAELVRELVRRKSEAISRQAPQGRLDQRRAQQRASRLAGAGF